MPAPDDGVLHRWLLETAGAVPRRTALVEDGRTVTFSDLAAEAAAMAAAFRSRGVEAGDRIALVLPKTAGAATAVFASLMAGAAYVPIHPRWPGDRIAGAIQDSGARLVVEPGESALSIRDAARPAVGGAARSETATILFTSGSTGRPKGVTLSHRAVAAFVQWAAEEFEIGADDRIACPSPLGFDLSTFDLFSMALRGASCVLAGESIAWMPRFLVRLLVEERVTCWYSVPSILTGMLRNGGLGLQACPDLRRVLFAGEVLPPGDLRGLMQALPHAGFANLYGPTETNVVTWHRVARDFDPSMPVPIGRACPYAHLAVDEESGELLAGGESLMTGYWNRPEETGHALTARDGRIYYRTGDRVTERRPGEYVFVGRLDRQIKRRGFRIELGEIEAALARHEDILEAAAVACERPESGTAITAFVRVRPTVVLSLLAARAHCAASLPGYMAPDRIVFLDAIPRGNRGKIDYAALQRLTEEHVGRDQS